MAAIVHPLSRRSARRQRGSLWRLPLALVTIVAVGSADLLWKAAAFATGPGAALDVPTSALKPTAALLVGVAALAGAFLLPRLCVPGALLLAAGVSSNLASLALFGAVPNPLALPVAGGMLRFNLADVCVAGGALLLAVALLTILGRIPEERFERR